MRPSVHDVPIAELAQMAASAPQEEDGGHDCVICGGPFSVPHDLEPTSMCNPCAQTAAVRLGEHVATISDIHVRERERQELLERLTRTEDQFRNVVGQRDEARAQAAAMREALTGLLPWAGCLANTESEAHREYWRVKQAAIAALAHAPAGASESAATKEYVSDVPCVECGHFAVTSKGCFLCEANAKARVNLDSRSKEPK